MISLDKFGGSGRDLNLNTATHKLYVVLRVHYN